MLIYEDSRKLITSHTKLFLGKQINVICLVSAELERENTWKNFFLEQCTPLIDSLLSLQGSIVFGFPLNKLSKFSNFSCINTTTFFSDSNHSFHP